METDYSPVQGLQRKNQRGRHGSLKCPARGCCGPDSLLRVLYEHRWLRSPAPGQGREQDDWRSSQEQGQGLNSAELHHQQTSVMQTVSTAGTVGRAWTSQPPRVQLSARTTHPAFVQYLKAGIWIPQQQTSIWLTRNISKEEGILLVALVLLS